MPDCRWVMKSSQRIKRRLPMKTYRRLDPKTPFYAASLWAGCMLFAFAVNTLGCRDLWIGWSDKQREKHLPLVVNNTRFLIFPWVQVENLASKALSLAAKRVAADWLEHHGLHSVLMESFVDTGRFSGACYKAANWLHIGQTGGRENKTRKRCSSIRCARTTRRS